MTKTKRNKAKKGGGVAPAGAAAAGGINWQKNASSPSSEAASAGSCYSKTKHPAKEELPLLPYPSHMPRPKILRNDDDDASTKEAFQAALDTAYEGFAMDHNVVVVDQQASIQNCLQQSLTRHFRVDVTQPFGLGTPCAKTYVTRCLVGDAGTTYKYLGLRMFAHAWPDEALEQLRDTLTQRTAFHLQALETKRKKRGGAPITHGRAGFDICLINRMENNKQKQQQLKVDSLTNLKTTVSWHADSSLEHYSSIAVYQLIVGGEDSTSSSSSKSAADWSVACRVAPYAEGPKQGSGQRRAAAKDDAAEEAATSNNNDTPILAVSLPSNSAYYLLDDFNHHHQHTVLTTANTGGAVGSIRYSCTYRLLRESHTVQYMLERCRRVVAQFHKKGTKQYRSEQLLLTELESEWLRQFYIQGRQHCDDFLLSESSSFWHDAMGQLLQYWSQLEVRTFQTVQFLRAASEGRCQSPPPPQQQSTTTKAERKARDRRKKAVLAMQELMNREQQQQQQANADVPILYESVAQLLKERSQMRDLWRRREQDHVFTTLAPEYRPMPVPLTFDAAPSGVDAAAKNKESTLGGSSPMPERLGTCASDLRSFGRAFLSGNSADLPKMPITATATTTAAATASPLHDSSHSKPLDWSGWNDFEFGLEMQSPWAGALVDGRKTIETRAYNLPAALLGKRIAIIQSPQGKAGISSMGNLIEFGPDSSAAQIVGWCIFSSVIDYTSRSDFERDEKDHLVERSSGYGWKDGSTKVIYGWVVERFGKDNPDTLAAVETATRRMRSLYQLHDASKSQGDGDRAKGRKVKKHRKKSKKPHGGSNGNKKQKKRRF